MRSLIIPVAIFTIFVLGGLVNASPGVSGIQKHKKVAKIVHFLKMKPPAWVMKNYDGLCGERVAEYYREGNVSSGNSCEIVLMRSGNMVIITQSENVKEHIEISFSFTPNVSGGDQYPKIKVETYVNDQPSTENRTLFSYYTQIACDYLPEKIKRRFNGLYDIQ